MQNRQKQYGGGGECVEETAQNIEGFKLLSTRTKASSATVGWGTRTVTVTACLYKQFVFWRGLFNMSAFGLLGCIFSQEIPTPDATHTAVSAAGSPRPMREPQEVTDTHTR